ncbi:hypothetical protein ACH79_27055 [Bradyrhizobium sp. CCBAU 051011]|nr:hypothetical protein ACH79_27055 [Bradyrhizobium sp. CCBAU 051011]
MRAHQIMTRKVITVKAETPILEAANLMLQHHISGLPVVDNTGRLIGIVSEGDFMRRSEIGTQGPRIRWLDFLARRRRAFEWRWTSSTAGLKDPSPRCRRPIRRRRRGHSHRADPDFETVGRRQSCLAFVLYLARYCIQSRAGEWMRDEIMSIH